MCCPNISHIFDDSLFDKLNNKVNKRQKFGNINVIEALSENVVVLGFVSIMRIYQKYLFEFQETGAIAICEIADKIKVLNKIYQCEQEGEEPPIILSI